MPADRSKSSKTAADVKPRAKTTAKWTAEHDDELVRAIIDACLSNREAMRHRPGFAGVNGNSGSKINEKLKQMLSKLPNGKVLMDEAGQGLKRGPRKKAGSASE